MEVLDDTWIDNKTKLYLAPLIKSYSTEVLRAFNSNFKYAIGLGDINSPIKEPSLFILLNNKPYFKDNVKELIEQAKLDGVLLDSYSLFGNEKHMVVFKIKKEYIEDFQAFIKGEYSQMYSTENKRKMIKNVNHLNMILKEDLDGLKQFHIDNIEKDFGIKTTTSEIDWSTIVEYDTPPRISEEIFNATSNKTLSEYFN